jgi:hypothetical protein
MFLGHVFVIDRLHDPQNFFSLFCGRNGLMFGISYIYLTCFFDCYIQSNKSIIIIISTCPDRTRGGAKLSR